jgi:hypothetical protein
MAAVSQNRRKSAWVYLIAGTFVAYYAVMVYSELYQPGRTGISYELSNGSMRIRAVAPDSPAGRAGLKSGDVLLAADGRRIRTWEDWRHFRATREIGSQYLFEVERAGRQSKVPVLLRRHSTDTLTPLERKRYVQGGLLLLALIMVFLRPAERVAQLGAWLLASIGTAPFFPDAEMSAIWRGLPTLLGLVLWIPQLSHLMLLPLFFTYFASLPRPLFDAKWLWVVVWSPALVVAAWGAPHLYDHVYHPPVVEELPAWIRLVLGSAVVLYGGGGLVALLVNLRRLTVPQERQRHRVLVAGALIGLAPVIPFLAAIFWGTLTQSPAVWFFVSDSYRHSLVGLFLAFPLSLGYALVRHRVLRDRASSAGEAASEETRPRRIAEPTQHDI